MTNSQFKKELAKAANKIALEEESCICHAIKKIENDDYWWAEFPQADMFHPEKSGYPDLGYWWGVKTGFDSADTKKAIEARLLGIAFMITMPEDMCISTNFNPVLK